eukprot:m.52318 g.52318  ORF g.52318 m.52318 type:complete len:229 (+) comp11294_c0_seq2:83-769(+)
METTADGEAASAAAGVSEAQPPNTKRNSKEKGRAGGVSKGKGKAKGKGKGLKHPEAYNRMNFLYQAANLVLERASELDADSLALSRFYINDMQTIAKRLVLRIAPHIKRNICTECNTLLKPGITAKYRTRARRHLHLSITCLVCGHNRRVDCVQQQRHRSQGTTQSHKHGKGTGIRSECAGKRSGRLQREARTSPVTVTNSHSRTSTHTPTIPSLSSPPPLPRTPPIS